VGGTTCGQRAKYNLILKEEMFNRFEWAQRMGEGSLHPDLKVGVFVTLCTPDAIKQ
jgi:hypothetical protein